MIRFLHTRIRVRDLDKSVAFYQHLGYTLRDFKDSPQGNKLAFLALPGNDVFLELCHSPDYTATCPEDLMHTALGVPDIIEYCDKVEKSGIEIWPSAWRPSSPIRTATRWRSSKIDESRASPASGENPLEESAAVITLTVAMIVKATTAFLLALVFQLAQLGGKMDLRQECAMSSASHCGCCAAGNSCHCADNNESAPRPAPLLPVSGNDLKLPLAQSGENRVSLVSRHISATPAAAHERPAERPLAGYYGVRLSVAFCSFVI
jgi:lactoylglutathione lyase